MVPGKDPIRRPGIVVAAKPEDAGAVTVPKRPAEAASAAALPAAAPGDTSALPATAAECLARGKELADKGQFSPDRHGAAAVFFREAVRLEPLNADAHYELGVSLAFSFVPDVALEAIAEFREAARIRPAFLESTSYNTILARAYVNLRRWDDALPLLQKAVKLDARHPMAWYALGSVLQAKGRNAEAAGAYQTYLDSWPDGTFAKACQQALAQLRKTTNAPP